MFMNPNEFGQYMKEIREKAGYDSQASLGKAGGVWNSTIARIEAGQTKNPDPVTLTKLAPFLKISVNELMLAAGYLDPASNTSLAPDNTATKDNINFDLPKPGEIPDELIPKITELIKQNLGSLTPAEKEYLYDVTKLTIEAIVKRNKEK
jgi:transcriptional regulator with XRE-family HTH domain